MEEQEVGSEQKERLGLGTDGAAEPLGKTIMDFFGVLAKWRRFIARFVLSVTVITTIVALLMPRWYKSTASVFPAEQTSLFPELGGVSSLFKSLSGGASRGLSRLTGNTEADRYTAILKSDRVVAAMVSKFNLIDYYEYSTSLYRSEKTAKELASNTEIELQDEGNLTVSVYDKDPQRASDMANYYIDLLNQTNSELMVQNARGNREFIEQRYQKNLVDLRAGEEAMQKFQVKYGVIAVPEQTEATIKTGAELYGKLAAKEIELDVLKRTASESHPNVAAANVEVQEIKKKLREMNAGTFSAGDDMKILVPFKQAPELAAQYIRLYRELQIQNKILEFISPLFEQAKVEEQRNTPSVVVLDRAGVPERKAKPKVSLYSLLAFVISMMLSLLVVFTAEGIERLRLMYPERFSSLVGAVRSDWFGLRLNGFSREPRERRGKSRPDSSGRNNQE